MSELQLETYYRDHWAVIEPARMARYEAMFQWRDGHEVLIAGARVASGQVVADYGCGPGALSIELARRVGEQGRVIGLDINAEFLEKTRAHAERAGLTNRIETRLIEDDGLPLDQGSVDRVVCKNVLEYVPDPGKTISEFYRVLSPGGIAHVSDSDWGAVIFEPARTQFSRIMQAAGIAFRTPLIGRSLYGLFSAAGFRDIEVQMLASPDTTGVLRPVITNMAGYARLSGQLEELEIDDFLREVAQALDEQSYFAVLPQFLVTGYK